MRKDTIRPFPKRRPALTTPAIPPSRPSMKLRTILLIALLAPAWLPAADNKPAEKGSPLAAALGATGAQAVFTNFFAIAELADLYGAKVYEKSKAAELAGTFARLTDNAKESLTDLIDSGTLDKSDIAPVQEMVIINDLLGKMAGGMKAFIEDPSDENEGIYDKNRKKAWSAISKFLGFTE